MSVRLKAYYQVRDIDTVIDTLLNQETASFIGQP